MTRSTLARTPQHEPRQRAALLGPQRHQPTLTGVVARLGVSGQLATITAGWQEREDEDGELRAALGGRGVNLRLHARSEAVYREDPELFAAHRRKQDKLRQLQTLYRMRLGPLIESAAHLQALRVPATGGGDGAAARRTVPASAELLEPEIAQAVASARALDEHHLDRVDVLQSEYEAALRPLERPSIARHRDTLAEILAGCEALALAGGHVAALLNRLRLFGIAELLAARPLTLIGWSAGAMVLTRRIVLFHDHVPGGGAEAEVLAPGLELCPGLVVLPDAAHRLELGEGERTELLALRFAPEHGVTLDDGDAVVDEGDGWRALLGAPHRLCGDGSVVGLEPTRSGPVREDTAGEGTWRSPSIV